MTSDFNNPGTPTTRPIPAALQAFPPLLDALAKLSESSDPDLYFDTAFDHAVVRPATQSARKVCLRRKAGQPPYSSILLPDVVGEMFVAFLDPATDPFDASIGILESTWLDFHANAAYERLRSAATCRPGNRDNSPRRRVDKCSQPPEGFTPHRPTPDDNPADEQLDVERAIRDLDAGGRLTDLEKAILRGHYTAGKTLREVSAELDAPPRVVYAAHEALLRKLRSRLRGYEAD